jgi:citrate lyase beta subunit
MSHLPAIRSLLFFPASDERKFARALGSEADAVVADLEDAVPPEVKAEARALVVQQFSAPREHGPARLVRINPWDSEWGADDLAALERMHVDGVVIPKANPEAVAHLGDGGTPVIAVIETAVGLRASFEIASAPGVEALQLGGADLGAELGLRPRTDGQELVFARSQLVVDSAAAGIRAPIDVVHLDVHDDGSLGAECDLARALGMRGKACIHPSQISTVNRIFAPTAEEIGWAREVIAAFDDAVDDGRGALLVRGTLVDLPIVIRARAVISEAEGGST